MLFAVWNVIERMELADLGKVGWFVAVGCKASPKQDSPAFRFDQWSNGLSGRGDVFVNDKVDTNLKSSLQRRSPFRLGKPRKPPPPKRRDDSIVLRDSKASAVPASAFRGLPGAIQIIGHYAYIIKTLDIMELKTDNMR